MDKKYSTFLEEKYDSLKKIVEKLQKKFKYVSLLATDCEGKRIVVSSKETTVKDSPWQERGFVVRVFNGTLFSEYSFDNFDNPNEVCKKITNSVDVAEQLYKSIYVKEDENEMYDEETISYSFDKMESYKEMPLDKVINTCKKIIDNSMEENEYIIHGKCEVEYLKTSKLFLSKKKDLKQVYAWANASYSCVVNKNDTTKSIYTGESGISLAEVMDKLKKSVASVNEDATSLLDSHQMIPGEYDCITSPIVSGLIAHEAFGHGVEMDMFVKNRAMGAKYINKEVGSPLVKMHDGAKPYEDVSSYFFDDEGNLAQDICEIENGVLKQGIVDAIAAKKLKVLPTGNGKRESYRNKVYTRMTNTYFAEGESTLKEMIESINHGFLIDYAMSGMEDPKNWGIQCVALIGKEIKNGELTGKVFSPIVMTGNVLDLLKSISMVSKDFKLNGNGACGKGYKEWVKTSIGGPYLKVKVKLG